MMRLRHRIISLGRGAPYLAVPLLAVALATFLPRLLLALAQPETIGDGFVYLTVARNILENACVSLSDPAGGACVPHWGGNQLPGYPAFLAATLWLGGGVLSDALAVGVAQSLVAALAAARLSFALWRYVQDSRVVVVAALVVALSPAHVAWSRLLLTESLAVSLAMWLFAELLLSESAGRLRVLPLAAALACSVFVRYDAVLLAIPVAIIGLHLHGPMVAIRRGAMIAVLVALPLGIWSVRSIALDLPFPPPLTISAQAETLDSPQGLFAWLRTWTANQYELQTTLWPALALNYSEIDVPERAFVDDVERDRVALLLRELAGRDGEPMPQEVDAAFAELAAARRSARPWERWLSTPIRRVLWMSLNPLTSLGWPSNAEAVTKIRAALAVYDTPGALRIAVEHPLTTTGKAVNGIYRLLLYGLLAFVVVRPKARGGPGVLLLLVLALSYWVARAGFYAVGGLGGPESRLLVEALPALEIAAVAGLYSMVAAPKKIRPLA